MSLQPDPMQIGAPPFPCPTETNGYLVDHARLLRESYKAITGRDLIEPALADADAARALFEAPFALLSHDSGPDPILIYANRRALDLFELTWERLVVMPSRLTAEAPERVERERLLQAVRDRGIRGRICRGARLCRGPALHDRGWDRLESGGRHGPHPGPGGDLRAVAIPVRISSPIV